MSKKKKNKYDISGDKQRQMLEELNEFLYGDNEKQPNFDDDADCVVERQNDVSFLGAFKPCKVYDDKSSPSIPGASDEEVKEILQSYYKTDEETEIDEEITLQDDQRYSDINRFNIRISFNKLILTISDSHKTISIDINGYCDRTDDIASIDEIDDIDADDVDTLSSLLIHDIIPHMYPTHMWNKINVSGRIISPSEGRPDEYFIGDVDSFGIGYVVPMSSIDALMAAYEYARHYIGASKFVKLIKATMLLYPVEAVINYVYRHRNDEMLDVTSEFISEITSDVKTNEDGSYVDDSYDFYINDYVIGNIFERDSEDDDSDDSDDEDDEEDNEESSPEIAEESKVTINGIPLEELDDDQINIFDDDDSSDEVLSSEEFASPIPNEKLVINNKTKTKEEKSSDDDMFVVKRHI